MKRFYLYPRSGDSRLRDGAMFPEVNPRFTFKLPTKIFTIGSCFARHIEESLQELGAELPTMKALRTEEETRREGRLVPRSNGVLNQYNPGTIAARVQQALGGYKAPEASLVELEGGWIDLLLPGRTPIAHWSAIERRADIDEIYEELVTSEVVIITLGLIETWLDEVTGLYINGTPPSGYPDKDRFVFRRLTIEECYEYLERTVSQLTDAGIKKILLTVSPVPLQRTFAGMDAVLANCYSKSVLRVCAGTLADEFKGVDYFPSYEMVLSYGPTAFEEDNIHVKDSVVRKVTSRMLEIYCENNSREQNA